LRLTSGTLLDRRNGKWVVEFANEELWPADEVNAGRSAPSSISGRDVAQRSPALAKCEARLHEEHQWLTSRVVRRVLIAANS
jgi:hypothetical protein